VTARSSRRSRVASSLLALGLGLLLAAASVAALEGACYLLNRAGLGRSPANALAGAAAPAPLLPGAHEVPSGAAAKMVHPPVDVRVDRSAVVAEGNEPFMDRTQRVLAAKRGVQLASVLRARDGSTVYATLVTTDEHGLRSTPDPFAGEPGRSHLATLGCSFTWGVGVDDDETFASQLAARLPDRHVYNFGIPGAGPNDLLAREEELGLFSAIQEPRGSALYLWIGEHVQRANGSMSVVGRWATGSADVEEVAPGEFRFRGSWKSARPIRTWLYRFLVDREITRFFQLDWPPPDRAAAARAARMIAALRREYRARTLPENDFFVVIFSAGGLRAELRDALDAEGLPYLDYSQIEWSRVTGEAPSIALDGHPAPPTYRALADAVIEDLHLEGRSGSAVTSRN